MAYDAHAATAHDHHDAHDHKPHGWRRWVYATNHKDIGTMYLVFAGISFFIGGSMAMLIRLELFKPGMQFLDPQFFNSMTTMHALEMIFGAVMPAWTGLANWMIPMQVGAPDMALPRLNNFSFWILPFRLHAAAGDAVRAGRLPRGWLDHVSAPHAAGWRVIPDDHLRDSHDGNLVDSGRDQCRRDHHEPACTGHDACCACRCSCGPGSSPRTC